MTNIFLRHIVLFLLCIGFIGNPAIAGLPSETTTYKNSTGQVYIDPVLDTDVNNFKFNYLMNCGGKYEVYSLNNAGRPKHPGLGFNYHESFTLVTDDLGFVPFSNGYDLGLSVGFSAPDHLDCSYCPEKETGERIIRTGSYCYGPEHIFVEKIAQLATVYNSYFIDPPNDNQNCPYAFTQYISWENPPTYQIFSPSGNNWTDVPGYLWPWNVFLTNNPQVTALLQTNKTEFFKIFIQQLKNIKQSQIDWWNQDISSKTVNEIICHLRREPQSITTARPWVNKKRAALDIINTGEILEDKEDAIIHLLAASNANEVLAYIEEKKVSYYFSEFDDFGGTDNLTRIMTLIAAKINEKGENNVINLQALYDNPSAVPALEADLWSWENLDFSIDENVVKINNVDYAYDDILPINITGTFSVAGTTYTKGLQVNMPAIQAALLAHDNGKVVVERGVWIAVDLGTLALGVGGAKILLTTGNYLRKAAIVGDLVGSTAGLAVQVLDNDAISPELRSRIQLVAFALSLPQIGISIYDAVTTARNLRTQHPNDYHAVQEGLALRREAARRDLDGYPEAWDFVRTNPGGAEAWEMLQDYEVYRKTKVYLEHISDYRTRTGHTYEELLSDFSDFEDAKKVFLDELADTPASGLYSSNPDGVWNLNPFRRGREIETALGRNLHPNFPWIDKFDEATLTVTSIKSTDTYASSYQNADNLESLWKSYVDNLASMPPPDAPITFGGKTVVGYNKQVLEIAIPDPLIGFQQTVKDNLENYATGKGYNGTDIEIIITVIE